MSFCSLSFAQSHALLMLSSLPPSIPPVSSRPIFFSTLHCTFRPMLFLHASLASTECTIHSPSEACIFPRSSVFTCVFVTARKDLRPQPFITFTTFSLVPVDRRQIRFEYYWFTRLFRISSPVSFFTLRERVLRRCRELNSHTEYMLVWVISIFHQIRCDSKFGERKRETISRRFKKCWRF